MTVGLKGLQFANTSTSKLMILAGKIPNQCVSVGIQSVYFVSNVSLVCTGRSVIGDNRKNKSDR